MTQAAPPYADRRARLVERVEREGLDALWITNLVNIHYLTGFTGSAAELLLTPNEPLFFTDGRYQEQVHEEVTGCAITVFKNETWSVVFSRQISEYGWKKIGYEAAHLTCETFEKIGAQVQKETAVEWISTTGWVESKRIIKDETEIALLKESSRIMDRVFEALLPEFREGVSEKEIERRLKNFLWEHGATDPSFDPIVLFGARTSLPHGRPGENRLSKNDWILLDFGALYEGYCSDCTRTFVFGTADETKKDRHSIVSQAYDAGAAAAKPGVPCKEVDTAARELLVENGLGDAFAHGLGHGVGLEIHEGPRLAPTSNDTLEEGMVVTIEPGIYIPGWGGIRIENAVVVTDKGAVPLTHSHQDISPIDSASEPRA